LPTGNSSNPVLQAIHESAILIHRCARLDELLASVAEQAKGLLKAESVLLFQYDPKWRDLHGKRNGNEDEIRFPVGQGIAGTAASKGAPVRTKNAPAEPTYVAEIDAPLSGCALCALAVPFYGAEGACLGVFEALSSREFTADDELAASMLAQHAGVAIDRVRSYEREHEFLLDLTGVLAGAVDRRNLSTLDHTFRVREYCKRLARAAGLSPERAFALEIAAIVHDMGRLEIQVHEQPDGTLDATALEQMKLHVLFVEALMRNIPFPEGLKEVPEAVIAHHEFLDGSGYPHGRSAGEIGELARMLVVADSFDAYLHGRRTPGRKPEGEDEALKYLKDGARRLFDPTVVDLFIDQQCYAIELRRFPRIDYETPVDVIILGPDGTEGRRFETDALDLSEGGILFKSAEPIPPHSLVRLLIHLPTEKIEAIAKVARNLPGDGTFKKVGAYFLWYGSVN
jgi:HD-GYP domain-containing protein (c-di-GMP phosphodiesterase class II)